MQAPYMVEVGQQGTRCERTELPMRLTAILIPCRVLGGEGRLHCIFP